MRDLEPGLAPLDGPSRIERAIAELKACGAHDVVGAGSYRDLGRGGHGARVSHVVLRHSVRLAS